MFWLNSLTGTGESAIAQKIAKIGFADGKLGASLSLTRFRGLEWRSDHLPDTSIGILVPPILSEVTPGLEAKPWHWAGATTFPNGGLWFAHYKSPRFGDLSLLAPSKDAATGNLYPPFFSCFPAT